MTAPFRATLFSRLTAWRTPEERRVFRLQMAAIAIVITLLTLGFYNERKVVEMDRRQNLERVVHGWDGLAWYAWLLAAPATLVLLRRHPAAGRRAGRRLAALAGGSVAIYLVISNLRYLLRMFPNLWLPDSLDRPWSWANYLHTQIVLLPVDFLTYSGFFASSFAIDYYFKYRQRSEEVLRLQLQAAQLEAELGQAQLGILRGHLHPHFLFNAFNAISTLVRQRKNELAVDLIARLGDLLRLTMDYVDQQELTLAQEFDFVQCYLDVERARFGDKLRVDLQLEPEALSGLVPNFLLQPLVENVIKHGISRRIAAGTLRLTAARREGRLVLGVADEGSDDPADPAMAAASGAGLLSTHNRLRNLYGSDFHCGIEREAGGGTVVRLDLPWRDGPPRKSYHPAAPLVSA